MKQIISIFFLCLAVVFSFGFTVKTSTCQHEQNKEVHSCCQSSKKTNTTKTCKGICCVQTISLARFEELDINTFKFSVEKKIRNQNFKSAEFLITQNVASQKLVSSKLFSRPILVRPEFIFSKTQAWLI